MKLFLKPSDNAKEYYINHSFAYSGDNGLDLFFVNEIIIPAYETKLIDLEISCELRDYNTIIKGSELFRNLGYWLIPRSSISKTPLRMSNSIGLIDSKYRHTLKVSIDNFSDIDYTITKGTKLFQIVAPNLETFDLAIVDNLSESDRGSGFGSSNKN